MGILLALVLLFTPNAAESQGVSARIAISPELTALLPPVDDIEAGLQRHFERSYGRFVDVSLDAAATGNETAVVTLGLHGDTVSVSTDLTRASGTHSLVSTVPLGATVSLLSTIAADIAFLHFSAVGLAALPLAAPPLMAATVQTDTLAGLASWAPSELEPIGIASAGRGVVVCFPHRYLTLGPFFRLTDRTVRDINQQAAGSEPAQVSGVASGAGGEIILVSEREGRIIRLDPRLGTRRVRDAPGISALGSRMVGTGSLAVLSNVRGAVGLRIFPLAGGEPRLVPVHATYVSACARDGEGNFWVWDAGERRIRIVTPGGREVYSIRPLFGAATMPLPQQLEVFDDGSFLLGGSGEVWKFQGNGMPLWRLARVPGRPGEKLPSSFALAVNAADGSFFLLDAPSRRLMMFAAGSGGAADAPASAAADEAAADFAAASAGPTAAFAEALSRLDGRRTSDLQNAAALARQAGLPLTAWQLGEAVAKRGGPLADREAGRIAVLRERSALYADFADSLARDLLFDRADAAYARAAESARDLADAAPADEDGAKLLQRVVVSRQEMRAAFSRRPDIRIVGAVAVIRPVECRASLVVKIKVRNPGPVPISGLRIHVSAPPVTASPSLAPLDVLAPGQEKETEMPLDVADGQGGSLPAGTSLHAAIMVTYQRGVEGVSVRTVLDIPVTSAGPEPTPADILACSAELADQLVEGLGDELLLAPADPPDPVADFAAILDSLGRLRARDAAAAGAAAGGAAARTGPVDAGPPPGVRETLRSLSPDERGWTLLTLSTAASLGLPVGLVSWQDTSFALVDTGISRADAVSEVPGLARYQAVLGALARGGTLCVPLSGAMPADPQRAAGWAVADALRACAARDIGKARIWWRGTTPGVAVRRPVPAAFPFPLPAIRVTPSRDTLRAEIIQSLEQ